MYGIVFDIKKFALHDGPGIRTTVFMKGCPLNCWWCHNPESIRKLPEKIAVNSLNPFEKNCSADEELLGRKYSADELLSEILKDKIFYDESAGGVTFSGGEPLLQYKFLSEVLRECRQNGINTAIDTSGYISINYFNSVYDFTDYFLFDLKLIDDDLHKKYTGVSNKLILSNLKILAERGEKVVIRIPLIPGITDTKENLSQISDYISKFKNINRVDLLPYNEFAESKYRRFNKPSRFGKLITQDEESLNEIKSYFNNTELNISIRG